ncbi:MAG: hypothetical protein JJU34_10065 [Lunatimonas sp.]|uniref:DUF6563 family protein n=1 Tax=Lunatimonas sp. TaxID=2060141 RepID=UPI00263A8E56|nr:DUF6563 family protein [Lunatimonas sp.]MCC5937618.1 hypothetical protein [Lunatimonas sp.]
MNPFRKFGSNPLPIGVVAFLLGLFSFNANLAQGVGYPQGVYMSFDELLKKSPSVAVKLEIERRTPGDIKMVGGNDYKLHPPDKTIAKSTIRKDYFAYSDGDSLYINGLHYKIQPWYAPVLSDGRYLVVRGGISMYPDIQKEQLNNKAQLGILLGPIGGGIQGAKLAMLRFIYVIDKSTNEITTVTSDYLKHLLAENPVLLEQFEADAEKADQAIFVRYLTELNRFSGEQY